MAGINLDQFSFWIGFLAATLSWGFIAFLRPTFIRVYNRLKSRSQKLRQEMMAGIDVRLNNDTLKLIQKSHLADRLFALDEILITPRLLAPRPQILPDKSPILEDTITNLLPYTPDWPEMAMLYGAPTITLAEALQETPRLIVMGRPGSGKTVTLAQLVAQIIRKEQLPGDLNERSPLWVHVGDLNLPTKNPENLLETLYDATSPYTSTLILPRLLSHIEDLFRNQRALLIMDGLDELPPENIDEVVEFISDILREFPDIPIVTTASMEYYGRLTELDFAPVALANWDNNQRAEFIRKWSEQWEKFVGSLSTNFEGTDPLLLNAWLFQDQSSLSPLELTLKVWAAYAGDTLGSKSIHSLESYVRRMTVDIPHGRDALEKIAHGIIRTYKPIFTIQEAEEWLSGTLQNSFKDEVEKESEDQDLPSSSSSTQMRTKLVSSRVLPSLQANGLINKRQDGRLQIVHSQILSYVGGITKINNGQDLFFIEKPKWTSAVEALGYHAININSESLITNFLQADSAPLYRSIFQAAFWLRFTDPKTSWRVNVVKKLVDIIRDARAPLGLRIRSSTALATSGVQGIETLFQTLLSSQDSQLRMIAVLGSGLIGNPVLVENLAKLINDQEIHVRKAAIFALVAIGSQAALEEIADILLHGEEEMRIVAAESLANHLEEGHPTLKDGATLDDLLVRRAVTYGLRRINQPWAIQLLEQMQIEDPEWAVKNVASEALTEVQRANHRLPRRFPALTETPWLIAFAGERGLGVSPGKPARALLVQALKEGKHEQKLAAIDFLLRHASDEDIVPLLHLLDSNEHEIREASFNAIWHLSRTNHNLSPQIE